MDYDYLYGWIKKNGHIRKNLTQKMVNPRDIAGNAEEEASTTMAVHCCYC